MAKTEWTGQDNDLLESFFEAARNDGPVPSEALLARVMADAEREAAAREMPVRAPRRRFGVWATLAAAIGGWPAMASMATAAAAGLWIGVAEPQPLANVTASLFPAASAEYELEDISPSYIVLSGLAEEALQ